MVIPDVSRYKIVEALKVFDQQYRNSPEFIGWESRGTQRYAIVHRHTFPANQQKVFPVDVSLTGQ